MTEYPDYNRATNAAYEVLKVYDGRYPKIDIFHLLLMYNDRISIHTYTECAKRKGVSVHEFVDNCVESEMGFTFFDRKKKRWEIFYNDTKCETTIRFTLAHELGHIVLEHDEDNDVHDKEANCFARNLLAPVPVRDGYQLEKIDDYCECFNISDLMAKVVKDLSGSDSYYITQENYDEIFGRAYVSISGCSLAELYY